MMSDVNTTVFTFSESVTDDSIPHIKTLLDETEIIKPFDGLKSEEFVRFGKDSKPFVDKVDMRPFIGKKDGVSILYCPTLAKADKALPRIKKYMTDFNVGVGYLGQLPRWEVTPGVIIIPDSVVPSDKLRRELDIEEGTLYKEFQEDIIQRCIKRNLNHEMGSILSLYDGSETIGREQQFSKHYKGQELEMATLVHYVSNLNGKKVGSTVVMSDPQKGNLSRKYEINGKAKKKWMIDPRAVVPMYNTIEMVTEGILRLS